MAKIHDGKTGHLETCLALDRLDELLEKKQSPTTREAVMVHEPWWSLRH